jgi:antitoxin MazE
MLHVDTDVHVPQVAENEEKTTWGRRVAEDKGRDAEEEHAGRPWPWKILSRLLGASPFSFAPLRRVVSPFFSSLAVRPDSGVQTLNTRLPQRSFAGSPHITIIATFRIATRENGAIMVRKQTLKKIGGSVATVLPKSMLDRFHLEAGDEVTVIETSDGLLITPFDPEFAAAMKVYERGAKKYRNALRQLAR